MVRLATVSLALTATFSGLAAAGNCRDGLDYCGYSLLYKGNYYNDIVAELEKRGQQTSPDHVKNSLFTCGYSGRIGFWKYCSDGCRDGGNGESDMCW